MGPSLLSQSGLRLRLMASQVGVRGVSRRTFDCLTTFLLVSRITLRWSGL